MSATLPESFRSIYGTPKVHEDTSDSQRTRCYLKRCETPVIKPSNVEHLLRPALDGKPAIIYANTVQRAQRYYRWFLGNGASPNDVVLYHSRFTEPDKIAIEEKLRGMLGKEAWETGKQRGVAILTQIGELSVNISADYMLSELCPLDRLVQRVGRLARFFQIRRRTAPDLPPQTFQKKAMRSCILLLTALIFPVRAGFLHLPLTKTEELLHRRRLHCGQI